MPIVLLLFLVVLHVRGEKWIKLPDIKPSSSGVSKIQQIEHEIPQVVFRLAPPPAILSSSDVISSVFSHSSTTTQSPIITAAPPTKFTNTKRYFQSTVTSNTVSFAPPNVSQLIDSDNFAHASLPMVIFKPIRVQKVKFFNQTTAMKVQPIIESYQKIEEEMGESQEDEEEEEEDDDGVTITDDLDDSEEYYYDEEEISSSTTTTTTTTTTKPPRREHKISPKAKSNSIPLKKSQRRIIAVRAKPDLSFSTFLNFLKTIQESLAIKTAKTITEKIKMLTEFRDSLMRAVNRQIRKLWRSQPKQQMTTAELPMTHKRTRQKRTLGGGDGVMEKGGAMDFPSSEGALLSICFLTFAVFLIKLVLQVIHTIKMKKAMWAAQMMTNTADGQNVVIKRHRSGRDVDEKFHNLAQTLEAIHVLKIV